jgi:hypothetical protein
VTLRERRLRELRVPESEVDIEAIGIGREKREAMPSVESPERANPYRGHADLALEKVEESGSLLHHHVDILDDRFVMNSEQPPSDLPQSNARFPVDRFFVERRVQVLAPQQPADERILRVQQSRAPEPIGVPPPDVVERREVVALALAYRSIMDVFEGVILIAGVRGFVDKSADVEVEFAGAEYDAVDEVHVRAPAPRREVAKEAAGIAVRYVPKLDEFLRPDRLGLDAQGVAESAEGVWKSEKQVAIVIARRANHDVAVGQEDLDFVDRLMCETVAERRGLDAEPAQAPPIVMDLSWGTTHGSRPCASVTSTSFP